MEKYSPGGEVKDKMRYRREAICIQYQLTTIKEEMISYLIKASQCLKQVRMKNGVIPIFMPGRKLPLPSVLLLIR